MDDSTYKCCKYIMIAFNVLFMLAGLGIMGLGIYLAVAEDSTDQLVALFGDGGVIFKYVGYALIGVGSLIALVAFMGCCGAWKESSCLLGCFNFFLVLFFLITAVITVGGFLLPIYMRQITETIGKGVITAYTGTSATALTDDLIDKLQIDNKCCGYDSGDDYIGGAYGKLPLTTTASPWPESCCVQNTAAKAVCLSATTASATTTATSYAKNGCFDVLQTLLNNYMYIIGGVGAGVCVIELLAIIFSCCISCGIGKHGVAPMG